MMQRLWRLFHKQAAERQLDAELQYHVERQIAEYVAAGMSTEEAGRRVRMDLGGIEQLKEESREARKMYFVEGLIQDLRFGVRMLRKNPGFTAVAILTLALGIGANTAIFSAVNGILIEHLPYAGASRLLIIERDQIAYDVSFAEARDIQEQCTAFERMAVYRSFGPVILGGAMPEARESSYVSGDFFPMMGVQPLLGRTIQPADTQSGQTLVAVLSYRFWMDQFGGDPRILGHEVVVEKDLYTIIGVMPKQFELGVDRLGDNEEGLWVPLVPPPSAPGRQGRRGGVIIARVKWGVSFSEANAQLQVLSARFAQTFPKSAQGVQLVAKPPALRIPTDLRAGLLVLLGAVGFVLLMASVNVSALLVARARTRQNELAIRRALGASRPRIVRQLLSESVLLALVGGALGLLFSVWGIRVLRAIAPPGTPRVDRIHLDGNVLWFTLGVSLLAAILFGLLPALQASSRRTWGVLKGSLGGSFAGSVSGQRQSLRSTLVITEVALAVILVVGGVLMARSFERLMHINTGVRADHVITMNVQLTDFGCTEKDGNYKCPPRAENILDGIRSLPGVEQAALTYGVLQGGMDWRSGLYVEGVQGNQTFNGLGKPVTPGYFAATGMRLLTGRDFEDADLQNGLPVAIVSESFAKKYIVGNPLGKRFSTYDNKKGNHVWLEIVGEVNDIRDRAVTEVYDDPMYYTPFFFTTWRCEIIARTVMNPMSMAGAIEGVVWSVDKNAPITKIETVDQFLSESVAQPRFQAVLLGSFGALGLILANVGIYGVISYSVIQRTHEIGVRMALGARPSDVLGLVIGQGGRLALMGTVFGLAGAWGLMRVLRNQLYEIQPTDPATFAGVATLLLIVALLACYFPARRATKVDPLIALRYE